MEYLYILVERDGLTRCINYRTFQESYQQYMNENRSCWIFIIDADKLKEGNVTASLCLNKFDWEISVRIVKDI